DRAVPAVAFNPAVNFAAETSPDSVAVGDFNGDGHPDLAVANTVFDPVHPALSVSNISVLLGTGSGTFAAAVTDPATGHGVRAVAVGDFNRDGHPDLAVTHDFLGVSVLLGTGSGTFAAAVAYDFGDDYLASVAVGDFNRDGNPDLAVVTSSQFGSVILLLGD